jgi:aminoglycoside 2'-N-acetyltransferase I
MTEVRTAHTADLTPADLHAVRTLLDDVFEGDFGDDDWDHSLGGVHVLVREGAALVGHGSLVQRRLLHTGRALRAGYVEAVGVHAQHRGRGHGATVMGELERVLRGAYDLGALSAAEAAEGFYAARGWERWRGPSGVMTPSGVRRTPDDDDGVHVLRLTVPLDLSRGLICDWRDGDVW